jgi:hypothetical protein
MDFLLIFSECRMIFFNEWNSMSFCVAEKEPVSRIWHEKLALGG